MEAPSGLEGTSGESEWVWILLEDPGCVGCGICADVCPHDAMVMTRDMEHPVPGPAPCTGCATCIQECPVNTLRMRRVRGGRAMATAVPS